LSLQAGLVCDSEKQKYNTGNLNLYRYHNIFFPDESFYNANEFPDEWMEMFEPQYSGRDELEEEKRIEKYSPKCTPHELNKMIDFNSYKKKSKYKDVNSKVIKMIKSNSEK
jgi:hypothetical protein